MNDFHIGTVLGEGWIKICPGFSVFLSVPVFLALRRHSLVFGIVVKTALESRIPSSCKISLMNSTTSKDKTESDCGDALGSDTSAARRVDDCSFRLCTWHSGRSSRAACFTSPLSDEGDTLLIEARFVLCRRGDCWPP